MNNRRSNVSRSAAIAFARRERARVETAWAESCTAWQAAMERGCNRDAAEILANSEYLRADMEHWNRRVMDAIHGRWTPAHDGLCA